MRVLLMQRACQWSWEFCLWPVDK